MGYKLTVGGGFSPGIFGARNNITPARDWRALQNIATYGAALRNAFRGRRNGPPTVRSMAGNTQLLKPGRTGLFDPKAFVQVTRPSRSADLKSGPTGLSGTSAQPVGNKPASTPTPATQLPENLRRPLAPGELAALGNSWRQQHMENRRSDTPVAARVQEASKRQQLADHIVLAMGQLPPLSREHEQDHGDSKGASHSTPPTDTKSDITLRSYAATALQLVLPQCGEPLGRIVDPATDIQTVPAPAWAASQSVCRLSMALRSLPAPANGGLIVLLQLLARQGQATGGGAGPDQQARALTLMRLNIDMVLDAIAPGQDGSLLNMLTGRSAETDGVIRALRIEAAHKVFKSLALRTATPLQASHSEPLDAAALKDATAWVDKQMAVCRARHRLVRALDQAGIARPVGNFSSVRMGAGTQEALRRTLGDANARRVDMALTALNILERRLAEQCATDSGTAFREEQRLLQVEQDSRQLKADLQVEDKLWQRPEGELIRGEIKSPPTGTPLTPGVWLFNPHLQELPEPRPADPAPDTGMVEPPPDDAPIDTKQYVLLTGDGADRETHLLALVEHGMVSHDALNEALSTIAQVTGDIMSEFGSERRANARHPLFEAAQNDVSADQLGDMLLGNLTGSTDIDLCRSKDSKAQDGVAEKMKAVWTPHARRLEALARTDRAGTEAPDADGAMESTPLLDHKHGPRTPMPSVQGSNRLKPHHRSDWSWHSATRRLTEAREVLASASHMLDKQDQQRQDDIETLKNYAAKTGHALDTEHPAGLDSCLRLREAAGLLAVRSGEEDGKKLTDSSQKRLEALMHELSGFDAGRLHTPWGIRKATMTESRLATLASDKDLMAAVDAVIRLRRGQAPTQELASQQLDALDSAMRRRRQLMGPVTATALDDTLRAAILAERGKNTVLKYRPADHADAIRARLASWGVPVDLVAPEIDRMLSESFGPDELNLWRETTYLRGGYVTARDDQRELQLRGAQRDGVEAETRRQKELHAARQTALQTLRDTGADTHVLQEQRPLPDKVQLCVQLRKAMDLDRRIAKLPTESESAIALTAQLSLLRRQLREFAPSQLGAPGADAPGAPQLRTADLRQLAQDKALNQIIDAVITLSDQGLGQIAADGTAEPGSGLQRLAMSERQAQDAEADHWNAPVSARARAALVQSIDEDLNVNARIKLGKGNRVEVQTGSIPVGGVHSINLKGSAGEMSGIEIGCTVVGYDLVLRNARDGKFNPEYFAGLQAGTVRVGGGVSHEYSRTQGDGFSLRFPPTDAGKKALKEVVNSLLLQGSLTSEDLAKTKSVAPLADDKRGHKLQGYGRATASLTPMTPQADLAFGTKLSVGIGRQTGSYTEEGTELQVYKTDKEYTLDMSLSAAISAIGKFRADNSQVPHKTGTDMADASGNLSFSYKTRTLETRDAYGLIPGSTERSTQIAVPRRWADTAVKLACGRPYAELMNLLSLEDPPMHAQINQLIQGAGVNDVINVVSSLDADVRADINARVQEAQALRDGTLQPALSSTQRQALAAQLDAQVRALLDAPESYIINRIALISNQEAAPTTTSLNLVFVKKHEFVEDKREFVPTEIRPDTAIARQARDNALQPQSKAPKDKTVASVTQADLEEAPPVQEHKGGAPLPIDLIDPSRIVSRGSEIELQELGRPPLAQ